MKTPESPIAATLYSFRNYCRTEAEARTTFTRLRDIGFRAVQVSGIGAIPTETVARLLDEAGLFCCATHENLDSLLNHPEDVVRKLRVLRCGFTALAYPGDGFWNPDGARKLAASLQQIGEALRKEGISFGYHNHSWELIRYARRKTMLEELIENTDPKLVEFELDFHWLQRGGGNPVSWIRKVTDRMSVSHWKDYGLVNNEPYFAEIGEGNLEWQDIKKACEEAHTRWYVIEQDEEYERSIFDSLKISFDYMRQLGID
jgi:sugar phosphate isomerase/epimerase